MRVGVIGTGYVGLVAGSCLADSGNDVICIDNDAEKVERLNQGAIPIYEPGLAEIVQRNLREGRLSFTTDLRTAITKSFVLFIAVGTPSAADGSANTEAVLQVGREIGLAMDSYKVVITKSTVPIGTTEKLRQVIRAETTRPFDVVANPEFLKEGAAVEDFMKPDRVIIGASSPRAAELIRELHAPFVRTGSPVIIMDIRSAELSKYAANAFLATRISFMNEMANLCEHVGADVELVRRALGTDSRIGPAFLFSGLGFGGGCFPKDIRALMQTAAASQSPLRIVDAVYNVNLEQRQIFLEKIVKHFGGNLAGRSLAIWGLSFKPRTNDIRESPALFIIESLLALNASVTVYDPSSPKAAKHLFGDRVRFANDNYSCVEGADALVLVTEWQVFRNPNFGRVKSMMRQPVIFDGRNIYDPRQLEELGFTYYGIGRLDAASSLREEEFEAALGQHV